MDVLASVATPPVSIQLLGPVRVSVRGAPISVDTRKALALVAYLAVTGRPAARESLTALLWPDSGAQEARSALRRTLSVLNSGLGGMGIAIDRAAVTLRPAEVAVDVLAFRAALARARDHRHPAGPDCPDCLTALDEAVGLNRGDFMAGFTLRDSEPFDEWQRTEAEAQRRDLAGALERQARGWAAHGRPDVAIVAARRWLELDPLHEPAHRLLMRTLAHSGETAAAIGQYRECVRLLDRELGVEPLAETTELYQAIRAGETDTTRPIQPSPGGPARAADATLSGPLVGRDGALAEALAAYASIGSAGRLVVLEGEPGVGKTRLAGALADRLERDGARLLVVRAFPGETSIPFAVTTGLLKSGMALAGAADRLDAVRPELLAEVARVAPVEVLSSHPGLRPGPTNSTASVDLFGHARLLEGLSEALVALVADQVPGVILVDDLQLADASSLELLGYLARRLAGRPVLLLIAWRLEEVDQAAASRILGPASHPGDHPVRLVLDRLEQSDVAALARNALGPAATAAYVDALFAESEGLPLYVTEALADASSGAVGRDDIPRGFAGLLRTRLGAVSEVASQVLAAAAVIGRTFDFETARAASGRGDDETVGAIDELVRRGLIREVPSMRGAEPGYEFTHGRLRDVAYAELGLARRRLLHGRVAAAFERLGSSSPDAGPRWARIAHHEELAGRTAAAAEAHRRAGDHARLVFANLEAREHLSAALALGHPAELDLREALGDVLTLLGDYGGAIAQLEAAASLAPVERLAAIEHRLGRVHARRGEWPRADGHFRAALALVGPGASADHSAILVDRSIATHRLGDSVDAARLAVQALEIAERFDDALGIARAANVLGLIERARPDPRAASVDLDRAVQAADRSGDVSARVATRNSLALVHADAGDLEIAFQLTVEALELCERQGDRHRQAALENNLADLLHASGRHGEAMDHLKRAVAIFAEIDRLEDAATSLEPEIWKLVEW